MPQNKSEMPLCLVKKTDCHAYKNGHCKCLIETKTLFSERCSFYKNKHQAKEDRRKAEFYERTIF